MIATERDRLLSHRDGRNDRVGARARAVVAFAFAFAIACAIAIATRASSASLERDAIDLSTCRAFANDVENLRQSFDVNAVRALRDATWIVGFWDARPGDAHHHPPSLYALGVTRTSCSLGAFGMNVMFVRDSASACAKALEAYEEGKGFRGVGATPTFGRGVARCTVKTLDELMYIKMMNCGNEQFRQIWINKIPLVDEVARNIATMEEFKDLKSSRYFWMDADVGLMQCHTGMNTYDFCKAIGAPAYYLERVPFPPFKWAHEAISREGAQDKMMFNCYGNGFSVGGEGRSGDALQRHAVLANMFGGSLRAIGDYNLGFTSFITQHIATTANGGAPAKPIASSCTTEENIMSSMAILDGYKALSGTASCAVGQPETWTAFKVALEAKILGL